MNTKPLAPVCEACGCAKPSPAHIRQQRARTVDSVSQQPTAVRSSVPNLKTIQSQSEPKLLGTMTTDPFLNPYGGQADPFATEESRPVESASKPLGATKALESHEQIASLLSGLDFAAPIPIQSRPPEPTEEAPASTIVLTEQVVSNSKSYVHSIFLINVCSG